MSKKKIDISIIIVRYQVVEELFACIQSIYDVQPRVTFEIIIVDNNTERRIGEALFSKFPNTIYVENSQNNGFGAGINLGATVVTGEALFIFNPDMIMFPDTLENLFTFLNKGSTIGAVAAQLTDSKGKANSLQGTTFFTPMRAIVCLSIINKIFPQNSISKHFFYLSKDVSSVREVDVVPGGAFLIKKSLFARVGGFDPRFFMYFEEHDLCFRLKKLGYRNYIIPQAKVYHIGGGDSKTVAISKIYAASTFAYFKKYYGVLWALIVVFFTRTNLYVLLFLCSIILVMLIFIFRRIFL